MSFDDLDRPKAKPVQRDLTLLGVAELRDYIAELQQEIARTEAEISKKEKDKANAEALFRKP